MSRSLESSGHDQETRSEPADLSDLRKQVYPKLFARRRDPKVFPAILRVRERPLWIRIALFCLDRTVSEGSSLCLRVRHWGKGWSLRLRWGASASPGGALLATPGTASDSCPKTLTRGRRP